MKLNSQIKIGYLGILSMTCLNGPAVGADTPALISGGYSTNQPSSFNGTKGWSFYNGVSSAYMAITQVGVFDQNGDGLANSHTVGVWTPSGTLLASATIPAGTVATLVDGYRYMPITPVLIPARSNLTYSSAIIAAQYLAGDADDLVTPQTAGYAAGVFPLNLYGASFGWYGLGTGLPFPNQRSLPTCLEFCVGDPFLEVNFQFQAVPEPSIPLLLVPGLLYLCLRCRHSLRNKRS